MPVLPDRNNDVIVFCEQHLPVWQAVAAQIGLTMPQIAQLATLTATARDGWTAAGVARQASKAATTTSSASIRAMRQYAADLIRQIKAQAELSENPAEIYATAQIPPPAAPSPLPPPGKPTNIAVTLEPTGAVTISWEASNSSASSGAYFNLVRKLPGQSGFLPLGGASGSTTESRRMKFTDNSVPASAAAQGAQYIIQGQRGTKLGQASDAITVQFGVDGNGMIAGTYKLGTDGAKPLSVAA
jgi:hypothetical protein